MNRRAALRELARCLKTPLNAVGTVLLCLLLLFWFAANYTFSESVGVPQDYHGCVLYMQLGGIVWLFALGLAVAFDGGRNTGSFPVTAILLWGFLAVAPGVLLWWNHPTVQFKRYIAREIELDDALKNGGGNSKLVSAKLGLVDAEAEFLVEQSKDEIGLGHFALLWSVVKGAFLFSSVGLLLVIRTILADFPIQKSVIAPNKDNWNGSEESAQI